MTDMFVCDIGRTRYADAWQLQQQIFVARSAQHIPDILLLTEHEHVFTLGKTADKNHLLATTDELTARSIDTFDVDRGGDITYHGPGQLVGYPIIDLSSHYHDTHRYLRDVEEALIIALADLGITAGRHPDFTGVWVGDEKIAAIGVKISRWITMHGFALNVSTDLSLFDRIIPCGIFHKGVTSIEKVLGRPVALSDVAHIVAHRFSEVFHSKSQWIPREELEGLAPSKSRGILI
ncbi:MAG: lipoyl(octanoyl) transferase LipB [Bacteroidota bacterium]